MNKVHLLSPDVISKIAAGEVIERPASVLKELVENALDAGATEISVRVKEAGKTLIHIKDNGTGIEKDDLEKIFLRHSTSKIKNMDDLEKIRSLGFRGEALYSVASIADIVLRSKTAGQESGWEVHFRGGKKIGLRPVAASVGTEIEVQELFFNTPARKKFLKSNTTEMNQILNIFLPYAISRPDCRFLLTHQDKDILDLPRSANLIGRIAHALGFNEKNMIESRQAFTERNTSVHLVLGDINIKRARRDLQYIFINGRPVQNRSLAFHINRIYRLVFPPENYPFFALFLELPPEDIDVNIHPTKREVKLKDEPALASLLRRMCEEALMSMGQAKQVGVNSWGEEEQTGIPAAEIIYGPGQSSRMSGSFIGENMSSPSAQLNEFLKAEFTFSDHNLFTQKQSNLQDKLSSARFIGAFIKKFLIFEGERSLFVIDQHAAQERIIYEQLKKQSELGNVEIQQLLSPILMTLTPQEMLIWEESKETLEENGLSSTLFDNQTIAIHSHPQLLQNPEPTIRYYLAGGNIVRFDHNTIASQACRSSVMAGDALGREQAEYQRSELIKCADPFTCPHGRPTVIEITEAFLDRQFLRT